MGRMPSIQSVEQDGEIRQTQEVEDRHGESQCARSDDILRNSKDRSRNGRPIVASTKQPTNSIGGYIRFFKQYCTYRYIYIVCGCVSVNVCVSECLRRRVAKVPHNFSNENSGSYERSNARKRGRSARRRTTDRGSRRDRLRRDVG